MNREETRTGGKGGGLVSHSFPLLTMNSLQTAPRGLGFLTNGRGSFLYCRGVALYMLLGSQPLAWFVHREILDLIWTGWSIRNLQRLR